MITLKSLSTESEIDRGGVLWNTLAIAYSIFGYFSGLLLLVSANGWFNLLGVILLTHSLILSAYLSHELMHGNIFKSGTWNKRFGQVMLWLNGGCYYGFQNLMVQHIAHHVKRVDVFTFDIPSAIKNIPSSLRLIIVALEWLYFPVVSFWSRWHSLIILWQNSKLHGEQTRILLTLIFRGCLFSLLALVSIKALLLYFLAYIGMITVLRWIDAFQHTYEAFPVGANLPKRDRTHEQKHTYSNLISRRYPWLNSLFLNFGYHNAHHANMKCPWYRLQSLDDELFKNNPPKQHISIAKQLTNYHQFRVTRLFTGQGEVLKEAEKLCFKKFYG
ncbi:MAG: fatty acid desaturase, partial [Candidatus Nanopelagicaceae bacterium]